MPSWAEIGQEYAADVRKAVQADQRRDFEYIKKAYAHEHVEPSSLRGTNLTETLKRIARELEARWKVEGEPLTEEQKDRILQETGEALGFPDPEDFSYLTKGASNDAYMQMTTYISGLLSSGSGSKK